jgi:heat shock protein HtpX
MGAKLAGTGAMISALEKLKRESAAPSEMPDSLTAFGITEGAKQDFKALFSSHPPLEVRIAALQQAK